MSFFGSHFLFDTLIAPPVFDASFFLRETGSKRGDRGALPLFPNTTNPPKRFRFPPPSSKGINFRAAFPPFPLFGMKMYSSLRNSRVQPTFSVDSGREFLSFQAVFYFSLSVRNSVSFGSAPTFPGRAASFSFWIMTFLSLHDNIFSFRKQHWESFLPFP